MTSPFSPNSLTENSSMGGYVAVTIANPAADISPSSQICRYCYVKQVSGTQVYMNINAAAVAAVASSWKLSTDALGVAMQNLNQLHFIGTAADVVGILWFN